MRTEITTFQHGLLQKTDIYTTNHVTQGVIALLKLKAQNTFCIESIKYHYQLKIKVILQNIILSQNTYIYIYIFSMLSNGRYLFGRIVVIALYALQPKRYNTKIPSFKFEFNRHRTRACDTALTVQSRTISRP